MRSTTGTREDHGVRPSDLAGAGEHGRLPEGNYIVTGVAGALGRLVVQRLHREPGVHVIGIDRRVFEGKPKDVEHMRVDLRSRRAREAFRREHVRALVHLGIMHDPRQSPEVHHQWNILGTQRLLEWCERYNVPKVVVLSSADVYGPSPTNPQLLTEDAPLLAGQRFPAMGDLVALDMLASSFFWKRQETETVVLRPVHILGSVRNGPSEYFRLPVVPTLLGYDPMMQVIHERDVVEAIVCALVPGVRGIFNVAGPGAVPLSVILRELGCPRVALPAPLARAMLATLFTAGATSFPPPELEYLRGVCMVDDSRARSVLGFRPRYSLRETIRAVGRDAALQGARTCGRPGSSTEKHGGL